MPSSASQSSVINSVSQSPPSTVSDLLPATEPLLIQMTRSIPEVNCGLICGCIPILPALFQHLRDRQLSTGQDTARKGRFHTLTNYTGRRPPGTERLNTSDIELDEAGLLGHAALNSTKTSVTKGSSDGLKIGSTLHHDQILKKIDIQQTSVKKAREDLG